MGVGEGGKARAQTSRSPSSPLSTLLSSAMAHASPNPWAAAPAVRHTRLGGLTGVLETAQSLGHPVRSGAAAQGAGAATFSSVRLLEDLALLSAARRRLESARGDAAVYAAMEKTRDVTYGRDVAGKVQLLEGLLGHVETLVGEKETLVARLSKPFAADGLTVEHEDQEAFLATLHAVVDQLAHFSSNVDLVAWMRTATLEDIRTDRTFAAMEASMARLAQYHEVLMATRKRFQEYDSLVRGE